MDISSVIFAAVANKYGNYNNDNVHSYVVAAIAKINKTTSAEEIIAAGSPTVDLQSDVFNQTRCILLIENYWSHEKISDKVIENIYATVFGIQQQDINLRHEQYVEDYGGFVPETIENIKANLAELNQQLKSVSKMVNASIEEKTAFLSRMFSGIIRTHPFQDGNGRTARMVVQFCLRYWGYKYMVVPKVRNNIIWKKALQNGIERDYKEMQLFFENEMEIDRPLN